MKKQFISVLVVLAAVMMTATGCGTTRSGEYAEGGDYTRPQKSTAKVTGDVPMAGSVIEVCYSKGQETEGPYVRTYFWQLNKVWAAMNGIKDNPVKSYSVSGGGDGPSNGMELNEDGQGMFAVVEAKNLPGGVFYCVTE